MILPNLDAEGYVREEHGMPVPRLRPRPFFVFEVLVEGVEPSPLHLILRGPTNQLKNALLFV